MNFRAVFSIWINIKMSSFCRIGRVVWCVKSQSSISQTVRPQMPVVLLSLLLCLLLWNTFWISCLGHLGCFWMWLSNLCIGRSDIGRTVTLQCSFWSATNLTFGITNLLMWVVGFEVLGVGDWSLLRSFQWCFLSYMKKQCEQMLSLILQCLLSSQQSQQKAMTAFLFCLFDVNLPAVLVYAGRRVVTFGTFTLFWRESEKSLQNCGLLAEFSCSFILAKQFCICLLHSELWQWII